MRIQTRDLCQESQSEQSANILAQTQVGGRYLSVERRGGRRVK
ncbi:Protein of unknown function [Gryllus bimaculatus]|nr:Protein of unknown function [Gryllus bimaculatus]